MSEDERTPEAEPPARPSRFLVGATWDDAPHLTRQMKATLEASIHPQFKAARRRGVPHLGAGMIYPVSERDIKVTPFEVPHFWPRAFGLDAGGGAKPTAACWFAHNREEDVWYLYSTYKRSAHEPAIHAEAIKARGVWIPGVGDCAALIVTSQDAEQLIKVYQGHGIDVVLPDKGVETGLQLTWELMSAQKIKVFASCEDWFEEYRFYRRDEHGKVVKKNDHLMDGMRYWAMSGRQREKVAPEPPRILKPRVIPNGSNGWMGA